MAAPQVEVVFSPLIGPDGEEWPDFSLITVQGTTVGLCAKSMQAKFLERYLEARSTVPAYTPFVAAVVTYGSASGWLYGLD